MRVRAKQYMYYDKKEYQAGDEYEMDDREESTAKLLSVLGKVEIVGKPKATSPTYQTRAVEPEEPKPERPMTTDSSQLVGSERRQYRRRDMKAER